jgi:hypothetical protein
MGGVKHLLVRSNSLILELVLDGAELVVGVQRLGGFSECWRVGVLEVPKCVPGFLIIISTVIVVAGGDLRKVLEGCKVGLAFSSCGFVVLKHEPHQLLHAGFRGWWRIASSLASHFRSHSGEEWIGENYNNETYAGFKIKKETTLMHSIHPWQPYITCSNNHA